MLNSSEYYNLSYDLNVSTMPTIETSITQIFNSLQSSVLNSVLYTQILFLVLVIGTIRMTDGKGDNVSWKALWKDDTDTQERNFKLLNALAYMSLLPAIYGVVVCISVKMELNL